MDEQILNLFGKNKKQLLREYTLQFGRQIVDMYEDLVTSARGQPVIPLGIPTAIEMYESLPDQNDLENADLMAVFKYLRLSKFVQIPAEWKNIIPKAD